jgi:hypothetical protein
MLCKLGPGLGMRGSSFVSPFCQWISLQGQKEDLLLPLTRKAGTGEKNQIINGKADRQGQWDGDHSRHGLPGCNTAYRDGDKRLDIVGQKDPIRLSGEWH